MEPAFGARQVSLGYEAAPFGNGLKLYGDEAITKAVIKNTYDFFNEIEEEVGIQHLNNIQSAELTADKCAKFIELIKSHGHLYVVPNEMNTEPSGSIRVTHKHTFSLTDRCVVGLIGVERLAALQASERTEITILGISNHAMESILRYNKTLRRIEDYKIKKYCENQYLLSKPKERECSCTIL